MLLQNSWRIALTNIIRSKHTHLKRPPPKYVHSYPEHFIYPIYDKKRLDNICKSKKLGDYKYAEVRAARESERYSVFSDHTVEKMVNYMMTQGKKQAARDAMYRTMCEIKRIQVEKYNKETDPVLKSQICIDPLRILKQAIQNCRSIMHLVPVYRGGQVYQVPSPITDRYSLSVAMKNLIKNAWDRDTRIIRTYTQLSHDILEAFHNTGRNVKQKIELHKLCEANRAYAHYRWS